MVTLQANCLSKGFQNLFVISNFFEQDRERFSVSVCIKYRIFWTHIVGWDLCRWSAWRSLMGKGQWNHSALPSTNQDPLCSKHWWFDPSQKAAHHRSEPCNHTCQSPGTLWRRNTSAHVKYKMACVFMQWSYTTVVHFHILIIFSTYFSTTDKLISKSLFRYLE